MTPNEVFDSYQNQKNNRVYQLDKPGRLNCRPFVHELSTKTADAGTVRCDWNATRNRSFWQTRLLPTENVELGGQTAWHYHSPADWERVTSVTEEWFTALIIVKWGYHSHSHYVLLHGHVNLDKFVEIPDHGNGRNEIGTYTKQWLWQQMRPTTGCWTENFRHDQQGWIKELSNVCDITSTAALSSLVGNGSSVHYLSRKLSQQPLFHPGLLSGNRWTTTTDKCSKDGIGEPVGVDQTPVNFSSKYWWNCSASKLQRSNSNKLLTT